MCVAARGTLYLSWVFVFNNICFMCDRLQQLVVIALTLAGLRPRSHAPSIPYQGKSVQFSTGFSMAC